MAQSGKVLGKTVFLSAMLLAMLGASVKVADLNTATTKINKAKAAQKVQKAYTAAKEAKAVAEAKAAAEATAQVDTETPALKPAEIEAPANTDSAGRWDLEGQTQFGAARAKLGVDPNVQVNPEEVQAADNQPTSDQGKNARATAKKHEEEQEQAQKLNDLQTAMGPRQKDAEVLRVAITAAEEAGVKSPLIKAAKRKLKAAADAKALEEAEAAGKVKAAADAKALEEAEAAGKVKAEAEAATKAAAPSKAAKANAAMQAEAATEAAPEAEAAKPKAPIDSEQTDKENKAPTAARSFYNPEEKKAEGWLSKLAAHFATPTEEVLKDAEWHNAAYA